MSRVRTALRVCILILVAAQSAAVWAQPNGNSSNEPNGSVPIPTLDGMGLAALAGGLAMAGTYAAMRRRNSKK